jgi:hypothetical protein
LIWEFFTAVIGCSFVIIFSIPCFYLKIRIKQANHAFRKLILNPPKNKPKDVSTERNSSNDIVKIIGFNLMISRHLKELNRICVSMASYNKFFSVNLAAVVVFIVPTNTFYLHNLINEKFDLILLEFCFYFLIVICGSILIIYVFMASLMESEMRKLYPLLNSLNCSNLIDLKVRFKVKLSDDP